LSHKERKDERCGIRYREAFKLRLVEDVAAGKYRSLNEASRRNGIRGCATLGKWMKQYGRAYVLPKRIKVETVNEIDELREARGRIRELEAARWTSAGHPSTKKRTAVSGVSAKRSP
jgi:transposase-like protein